MLLSATLGDPALLPGDATLAAAAGTQYEPQIARGANSSLVVWTDNRTSLRNLSTGVTPFEGTGQGSMHDIYAARLDASGAVIDTTPIVVSQAHYNQTRPRVGWNGQNWLVAWTTEIAQFDDAVHAVRIAPDGTVLDPTPLVLYQQGSIEPRIWSVASDGSNWVVTWLGPDVTGLGPAIFAGRVSPDGAVLNPGGTRLRQSGQNFFWGIDMAFAGDEYLLTWRENAPGTGLQYSIRGQLLTPALAPVGPMFTLTTSSQQPVSQIATDGNSFFVVWSENTVFSQARGSRVSHAGEVLEPGGLLLATGALDTDVVWDGTNWLAVYNRPTSGFTNYDLFATRITPGGMILDPSGFAVVAAPGDQNQPSLAPRPAGGAQLVWRDAVAFGPEDILTASIAPNYAVGAAAAVSLSAPRQSLPRMAAGGGGFLAVYRSETSGQARVLAQRLDAAGNPVGAQPLEIASGNATLTNPSVAWNGSAFLVVWQGPGTGINSQVFGRRVIPDGTVLDPTPLSLMPGMMPDVAARGDTFLVAAIFRHTGEFQSTRAVRVSGEGAVLGAPVQLGTNFDVWPRIGVFPDRWLVTWERNVSHDNPASAIDAAFVNADGTTPGRFLVANTGGDTPHLASAGDSALIVWGTTGTTTRNIVGRRIQADGTLLGPATAFVISGAPQSQYVPAVAWDGSQYLVTWIDHRNEAFPDHPRGDIYAARVDVNGTVLDPSGFVIAHSPLPEETPTVVASRGLGIFAYSAFNPQAPYAAFRITLRTFRDVSAVINGGFEAGIGDLPSNWALVGEAGRINNLGPLSPSEGAWQAFLTTGPSPLVPGSAVSPATVAAAFGVSVSAFPIPPGILGPLIDGSAVVQEGVFANAGDVLTFDWLFLTSEDPAVPTFDTYDVAYAVVSGPGGAQVIPIATPNTPGLIRSTGAPFYWHTDDYRTGSITFDQTGTYTIGFAVFNTKDPIDHSGLLVDNVQIQAVPAPPTVTGFTPTSTGFTARFNQPLDATTLNLYGTETGGLGPADVTVVGTTTGPVRGSLVVNPAGDGITFIRTGGPLPADTYTVTLRSATDGFRTTTGVLLDGNGDGNPGDNYSTTFSTTSLPLTVSVPDFARGPGQPVNVPATAAGLPLRINDGTGVTSVNLSMRFNPSLLSIARADPGPAAPAGSQVTFVIPTSGMALVTFTSPTPLGSGPIDFVSLTATVPTSAGYGSQHVVDLTGVVINGSTPAMDDDGIHVVGYFGDASGNGSYSATDAVLALRVAVGLDTGFSAYRAIDPTILADITGDGLLSSTDATRILQEAVGIDRSEIPPLPGGVDLPPPPAPAPPSPADLDAADRPIGSKPRLTVERGADNDGTPEGDAVDAFFRLHDDNAGSDIVALLKPRPKKW